jgi:predicted glycoside hydrolase/deacetylase ChbG (UPF0249 family)
VTPGARIVLHADDFGMNGPVNAGIIAGFSQGVLTSTAILANGPGFDDAVGGWMRLEQARVAGRLGSDHFRRRLGDDGEWPFDLGVHLNLTQGTPLTPGFPQECLDSHGRFAGIGRILRTLTLAPGRLRPAVEQELDAQIARVVDAGLRPTHLNGHHYVELIPALAEPIRALAVRFQIPAARVARERHVWTCLTLVTSGLASRLRQQLQHDLSLADAFIGTAHAGRISLDLLRRGVRDLRPGSTLEVGLHPGDAPRAANARDLADGWRDAIANLRPSDLALVQSPQLVELLAGARVQLGRIAWLPRPAKVAS